MLLAMVGCERDALPWLCPDIAEGTLVVSEIRGPQTGDDDYVEWIELYNAGTEAIDLEGVRVEVKKLDGSGAAEILVRQGGVDIGPSGYAVVGRALPGSEPGYVDYGYMLDFDSGLYDTAAVDVISCGHLIDRTIYRNLPNTGTWALSGASTPDAQANDMDTAWCIDDSGGPDPALTGVYGSPGQANLECQ